MQTLTDLDLSFNEIGDEGGKLLAAALRDNRVEWWFSHLFSHHYFFTIQTLNALTLNDSQISDDVAPHFVDLIKNNTVFCHFLHLIDDYLQSFFSYRLSPHSILAALNLKTQASRVCLTRYKETL